MAEISKLDPMVLVGYFFLYIILHVGIILVSRHYDKRKTTEEFTEEEMRIARIANFLATWFPAFYVLLLLWVL